MPNDEKETDEKALALAALRATLNPSAHTDSCMELRGFGVRTCTHVCAKIRAAVERLSGETLPGADWPGEQGPVNVPDLCRACSGVFNFGGGYCPKCGAPFLPPNDPTRPHRLHVSMTASTEEAPELIRALRELAEGRQPSFNVTLITPAEETGHAEAGEQG